jgi:hypothetical protein
MKRPGAALLAATLLFACPPAAAQDVVGEPLSARDAIRTLHDFGLCLTRRELRDPSRRVLALVPGSAEETVAVRRLVTPRCLEREARLNFNARLIRGALAEGLFRGDFGRIGGGRRPDVALFVMADAMVTRQTDASRRALLGLEFAQCIAAAAPADAQALLGTEPVSPSEDAAFARLQPQFAPCLRSGVHLSIVKSQLRGFIAEALYRAAYDAAGSR